MKKKHNSQQHAYILLNEKTDGSCHAYLDIRDPAEFIVEQDTSATWLTVAVPAALMDELALSWCRQRQLLPISASAPHLTVKETTADIKNCALS
ncbi:hypothetical protein QE250_05555 [Chromatiaceae bacterium AAb-1]|nr:hypothetical protein [Chromatiaceae bacterium AAb-1]